MINKISTNQYKSDYLLNFVEDLGDPEESVYLFVGDYSSHANSSLADINDNILDKTYAYKNMIAGKRIANTNFNMVTRYVPWSIDYMFAMYDDTDKDLPTKDFFCITEEGSYYHFWKCLDNNNDSASTVVPQFSDIHDSNTVLYQTSDGYRWKYMASVDETTKSNFKVETAYFPVVANTVVKSNAVSGALNIIKVIDQGKLYNNYISGSLRTTDISINGDKTLFNLSNPSASSANGYYTGCSFYITTGAAKGQIRTIVDYVSNSTGYIVQLDTPLLTPPINNDQYEIYPGIKVLSDNRQTINCAARALVNASSSNTIYRIEVLEPGKGYKFATATVVANSIVGVANAALIRPIIGPPGGHGFDIINELYSSDMCMSVYLSGDENGTIPATNIYQQFGLLKNPEFTEVVVTLSSQVGTFNDNETITQFVPKLLTSNCTLTVGGSTVVSSGNNYNNFIGQIWPGQMIYVTSPDHTQNQLNQVYSITNSTCIITTWPTNFAANNTAYIYNANVVASHALTTVIDSNKLLLSNVEPILASGSILINNSGSFGVVNSITRNGVNKYFETFVAMYKYTATGVNGNFTPGEAIDSTNGYGYIHSYTGSGTISLYMNNFSAAPFAVGDYITGRDSGSTATISAVYNPEIVWGSGAILYLENIPEVTRLSNQNEQFQVIFSA